MKIYHWHIIKDREVLPITMKVSIQMNTLVVQMKNQTHITKEKGNLLSPPVESSNNLNKSPMGLPKKPNKTLPGTAMVKN